MLAGFYDMRRKVRVVQACTNVNALVENLTRPYGTRHPVRKGIWWSFGFAKEIASFRRRKESRWLRIKTDLYLFIFFNSVTTAEPIASTGMPVRASVYFEYKTLYHKYRYGKFEWGQYCIAFVSLVKINLPTCVGLARGFQ